MNRQQQQLVEDNIKLVYHILHTDYKWCVHDEEMVQVAMVGLCQAAETWDEEKGLFTTYSGRCIRNQLNSEFVYKNRMCRSGDAISLESPLAGTDGETTLGESLVGQSDVELVEVQTFYDNLTDAQKQLVDLRLLGYRNADIARMLGTSRSCITQRLRILEKRWEKLHGS